MNKKFFALFVAVCLMFSAVAANATEHTETIEADGGIYQITYDLEGVDNTDLVEIKVDDPVANGNFQAIYQLPQLEFTTGFTYTVATDSIEGEEFTLSQDKIVYEWNVVGPVIEGQELTDSKLTYSLDKNNNLLVISGILPDLYNKIISYDVVATIKSINTSGIVVYEDNAISNQTFLKTISEYAKGTSFDSEITIELPKKAADETQTTYIESNSDSFSDYIEISEGTDLTSVTSDYSVTVKVPYTASLLGNQYPYFIATTEDNGAYYPEDVQLPSWLKVDTDSIQTFQTKDEETYITSFKIVANTDSYASKGTEGVVRIALMNSETSEVNTYLQWDVTCDEKFSGAVTPDDPDPTPSTGSFEISSTAVNFSLAEVNASKTETLTYTGDYSINKYEATGHMGALIEKNFLTVEYTEISDGQGTITLKATAPSTVTYEGTLKFFNTNGESVEVSVTIGVGDSSDTTASLTLKPTPDKLELEAGGTAKTVTIAASATGIIAGTAVTWSVKKNGVDLNVSPSSFSSTISDNFETSATFDFQAPAASVGVCTVTILAETDDGDGLFTASKDIDIEVTAKESSSGGQSANFSLSANPSAVNVVKGDDAQTVNITVGNSSNVNGSLTWSSSPSISGLTVNITNKSKTGATVSVKASSSAAEKTYTVTITAKDNNGSKSIPFSVVVSATELTEQEKYAALIEANAEKIKSHFSNADSYSVAALDTESAFLADEDNIDVLDFIEDFAELDPSEVPVLALNAVNGFAISESKIYVFPVSYDLIREVINDKNLLVGEEIFVHMLKADETVSDDDYGIFVDNNGNQITRLPPNDNAGINIAAYLEEYTSYWPVISRYALTKVTTASNDIILEAGETKTAKFTANKLPAYWKLLTVDDDVLSWKISTIGNIANISLTADSEAEPGDYEATVVAYDSDYDTTIETDISITILPVSVYSLDLVAVPSSLTLTAGGEAKTVTVTADEDIENTLTWRVRDNGGLTVNLVTAEEDEETEDEETLIITEQEYNIRASSAVTAGVHTVVIEVSDGTNIGTVSIPVTVINSSSNNSSTDTTVNARENFFLYRSAIAKSLLSTINESLVALTKFTSQLSRLAADLEIAALNVDAAFSSESRTVYAVEEDIDGEVPILALPLIDKNNEAIEEAKIYVFAISISDKIQDAITSNVLSPDSKIFIHATDVTETVDSDDVDAVASLSSEEDSKGMFLDDEGNEITTAQELLDAYSKNSGANVAVYLEPETDYSLVITTLADENNTGVLGPSGAGCNGGSMALLSLMAMTFASGALLLRMKGIRNKNK